MAILWLGTAVEHIHNGSIEMHQFTSKRILFFILAATGLVFFVVLLSTSSISAVDATKTNMIIIERSLRHWERLHGALPSDLDQVFQSENQRSRIFDAWGNRITYLRTDSSVTLYSSLGGRELQSGLGMYYSFNIHDPIGAYDIEIKE